MTTPLLFTVIIPAYNAELTLAESVSSVLHQTVGCSACEILIIDDGSTDDTYALMQKLAKKNSCVRILQNKMNRGLGETRNRGIQEASGIYILFLDSDDILRNDCIEIFSGYVNKNSCCDVVYANVLRLEKDGRGVSLLPRPSTDYIRNKISGNVALCAPGAAYKRKFLEENKIFFCEGVYYEDIVFGMRVALLEKEAMHINEPLYYWVVRQGSITQSISEKKYTDAILSTVRVYMMLCKEGVFQIYKNEWKSFAEKMLTLITERILTFSAQPTHDLSRLYAIIDELEILRKNGITSALVRNIQPLDPMPHQEFVQAAEGTVVFVALTDGHVRMLAPIVRQLVARSIPTLLIDTSRCRFHSVSRAMKAEEAAHYADLPIITFAEDAAPQDVLAYSARLYVFAIDWGAFREVIHSMRRFQIPVFGYYEGINDDTNLHRRPTSPLPYRIVDALFIPGDYYHDIYIAIPCHVTGLPSLGPLLKEQCTFPECHRVIINSNFSYGVLEECRSQFLQTAVAACEAVGVNYAISQHPADLCDLSAYPVSTNSIYNDLRQGSLLISRFSTCILESLALGKPVIYHNPHNEKFPKFQDDPMGAFTVTRSQKELEFALRMTLANIESNVDTRKQSQAFMHRHANILCTTTSENMAADIIANYIATTQKEYMARLLRLVTGANITINTKNRRIIRLEEDIKNIQNNHSSITRESNTND